MADSDQSGPIKSKFSRDVLTLVTGTTISQIITILAAPIITRLYGPEAFGLLAIFTSITGLIGVIACLRYELAIMLPKSDEEAANVFGLCIFIVSAVSLLSIPILALSYQYIEIILNSQDIGNYFWLIPPYVFLSGMFLALNYWNTRTKHFHRLAIAQVMRTGSQTGTQLGFGITGYTTGGILIGATVLGQVVSTLVLGIQILRNHITFFIRVISTKEMIIVLKRYSNFPKYDIWAALLNAFSSILPIFVLTAYFNPTIVGYYSLGLMVLQFPLSFIQGALAQVFFQKAAEAKNISHEQLKNTVLQMIKPMIFVVFLPVILFILIGPEIFSVVFGSQWAEAGNYVRFLSLWIGITFISSPISILFSIFQKQQFSLFFNVLQLILRVVALITGAVMGSALIAIILFAIVGFITNFAAYFYLLRLSGISIMVPIKIVLNFFMLSLPFILCILLFKRIFSPNDLLIVIFSLLISIGFPLLVIKRDPEVSGVIKSVTTQLPIINKFTKYLH